MLAIALVAIGLTPLGASAATFTVDSPADPGDGACVPASCTLREAIDAANVTPGEDTILFSLSPGATITPTSVLPAINEAVTIDGTGVPGLTLDGGMPALSADGLTITSSGITIQGLSITGFGGSGVVASSGLGNKILGNEIWDNDGLGIDLDGNGVTPNDPGDVDSGPNGLQNFPVLTMASSGNGVTVVRGSLNSTAGAAFRIELFSNILCNIPEPFGEGQTFLGWFDVNTDPSGTASFISAVDVQVPAGSVITATATGPEGTSEFSACQTAFSDTAPPTVSVGNLTTFQTETSFVVSWDGSDPSGVSFHVLVRQAPFNKGFGDQQAFATNVTSTSETFTGKPGMTYCFEVVATDPLGNSSSTGEECSAVLVDDTSMKHRKGFKQRSGGDHFMGTFSWARRKGATLILSGVQADQLA
ncbi:MAG: CSLREA domain-containing protein, partial [Actinomycetota bacterium]